MTSNIGSSELIEGIDSKGQITEEAREHVMDEMKMLFRPEFLNRVDDIVLFTPLQKEEVYKIIEHVVKELEDKLKDRHISLVATDAAKELILNESYSCNMVLVPSSAIFNPKLKLSSAATSSREPSWTMTISYSMSKMAS